MTHDEEGEILQELGQAAVARIKDLTDILDSKTYDALDLAMQFGDAWSDCAFVAEAMLSWLEENQPEDADVDGDEIRRYIAECRSSAVTADRFASCEAWLRTLPEAERAIYRTCWSEFLTAK